jgi:hypothetical protein
MACTVSKLEDLGMMLNLQNVMWFTNRRAQFGATYISMAQGKRM